jgi:hypothetical protein
MVEPVTIVTATITILRALTDVVQCLYRAYTRARTGGKVLLECYLRFLTCQTYIDKWKEFWSLDAGLSRLYQEMLWGRDGSQVVFLHLSNASCQMEDAWQKLKPQLIRSVIAEMDIPRVRLDCTTTDIFRTAAAMAQKKLPLISKLKFAGGQGLDFLSRLSEAMECVLALRRVSEDYFKDIHGAGLYQQPPRDRADQTRMDTFMQAVMDARAATNMYFDAHFEILRNARTGQIAAATKLVLDGMVKPEYMIRSQFGTFDSIPLRYHLLLMEASNINHGVPSQIIVDGPSQFRRSDTTEGPGATQEYSINEAYYQLRVNSLGNAMCEFSLRSPDHLSSAQFSAHIPLPNMGISHLSTSGERNVQRSLRDILRPLPTTAALGTLVQQETLPRSARLLIAHNLILSGLFLSGSPWFDLLRDGSGKLSQLAVQANDRCVLEIKENAIVPPTAVVEFIAHHISFIGLVLIELGVGRPLQRVEPSSGIKERSFVFDVAPPPENVDIDHNQHPVIQYLLASLGPRLSSLLSYTNRATPIHEQTTTLPTSKVYQQLTEVMGEKYTEVVQICLDERLWRTFILAASPSQRDREMATLNMLRDYLDKLYFQ